VSHDQCGGFSTAVISDFYTEMFNNHFVFLSTMEYRFMKLAHFAFRFIETSVGCGVM
jgi:hypothetical protein